MIDKKTILIVEDDVDVMIVNEVFLTSKGYTILKATTLQEARNCLTKTKPSLILLDVNLPDGSGIDFCENELSLFNIPVIFLTSYDSEMDKVNGLMLGGDDYITKPYLLLELHARIEAVLRRTRSHERIITIYPYEIHVKTRKVLIKNEDCLLNQKEFNLLMVLLENAEEKINREDLYQKVWNELPVTSALVNTVNVNISTLRKKLCLNDYDSIQIDAIRPGGYCLRLKKEE